MARRSPRSPKFTPALPRRQCSPRGRVTGDHPADWPSGLVQEATEEAQRFTAAMTGEWPVYDEALDEAVARVVDWAGRWEQDYPGWMPDGVYARWEAGELDQEVRAFIAAYYGRA